MIFWLILEHGFDFVWELVLKSRMDTRKQTLLDMLMFVYLLIKVSCFPWKKLFSGEFSAVSACTDAERRVLGNAGEVLYRVHGE